MKENKKQSYILVIEDEKDMANILVQVLQKEGYKVESCYDGLEGLKKIRSTKPDMVLLDVMLPGLDGRDLLKKLKDDSSTKDIPVIIISAKTEPWDRKLGLELGAEEYIEKPLEIMKLLRQIRDTLNKR